MTAEEIILCLDLKPHPEGGWYGETFRDAMTDPKGRSRSTAIHYLLKAGEASAWHRVDAVEHWAFHAGAPLELRLADPDGSRARTLVLGLDLAAGQRPQAVVAQGGWQAARSLGGWTLVGCVVAPGFEFSGFELAPAGWEPAPA